MPAEITAARVVETPAPVPAAAEAPPSPPATPAATISEPSPYEEKEPVMKTRDAAEADDEFEQELDIESSDTVGSKRRGIRLKQDLN